MLCPAAPAYQQSVVYSCPMHPEVQSSRLALSKVRMKLVVQKPAAAPNQKPLAPSQSTVTSQRTIEVVKQAEEYTCSMHPIFEQARPASVRSAA